MIAKDHGRYVLGGALALTLLGLTAAEPAQAQLVGRRGKAAAGQNAPAAESPQPPAMPRLVQTMLPANPSDPIAIINSEAITRQQLADEVIARKGEEVLETLIARRLIEQALRAKKMEVSQAEVDAEIDNVAGRIAGVGRKAWLETLDKERGISPVQYARDIIYPALALRKLAASKVQVTPDDLRMSYEALYGDKVRCRIIMVDKVQSAKEVWEALRRNPNGFEKLAMDRSMDESSRSLGGLVAEPISRHAHPRNVSDSVFRQLVDGDSQDKDPKHKPTDGSFTGPIQVAEATWAILRREQLIPAQAVDPKDPAVKKSTYEMIYEVKLKEAMSEFMADLMQQAAIDNKLTGRVKMANEQMGVDKDVQLMGGTRPGGPAPTNEVTVRGPGAPIPTSPANTKLPTPAALSPEVVKQSESMTKPSSRK